MPIACSLNETEEKSRFAVIAPIAKAANRLFKSSWLRPRTAVVLGSAFGQLCELCAPETEIPYEALPGFALARVRGHSGKLILGRVNGAAVAILAGRSHFYEGHSLAEITFPIRVLAAFGVENVLLTNAAGGINSRYRPGDLMAIADHINWMGDNPLRGLATPDGSSFVDLSQTYDPQLRGLLHRAARELKIRLHSGVYAAVSGPTYETPAEVRALARLGADAVGMSTVPEAIVARHCQMRVMGLSCITNRAAGLASRPISHTEVLEAGARAAGQSSQLVRRFIQLSSGAS